MTEMQKTLQQIAELTDQQEQAINEHPRAIALVFRNGVSAFIEGASTATDSDWSRSMSLSLDELSLMHRYMLASSFISAWYHLTGDKRKRDIMAQSCTVFVASLGPDPGQVMRKYVEYEQGWRMAMKSEGISPRKFLFIRVAIIGAAILLSLILFIIYY